MDLIRKNWTLEDGEQFKKYLLTFSKGDDKSAWEKRIVNTELPCISVQSPDMKRIISQIGKGNYMEFIDLWMWDNFSLINIIGGLICKISDFSVLSKYLYKYASQIDNWGNADMVKLVVSDKNKQQYFDLSLQFVLDPLPFVRRVGVNIMFKFIDDDRYIYRIFQSLNGFYNETEYYVNMVNAWIIAECFAKQRDKTLEFLKSHNLNKFTINKAISKCRDSFRVSEEDKKMLLKFRMA